MNGGLPQQAHRAFSADRAGVDGDLRDRASRLDSWPFLRPGQHSSGSFKAFQPPRRISRPTGAVPQPRSNAATPFSPTRNIDLNANPTLEKRTKKLSEVQLTKNFLEKEIAARSQKISVTQKRVSDPSILLQDEPPHHKIFIVSTRFPFTIYVNEETGALDYERDDFETDVLELLASASVKRGAGPDRLRNAQPVLVGCPVVRRRGVGRKSDNSIVTINDALQEQLDVYLRNELKVVPVFLPPNRDRFADWVIFPLFHYLLPSAETGMSPSDWEGYELVNELFRDAVLKEYSRGDFVWINDYPLMLLPKLLRTERPDIPVGFYLHCVFPSSEVYRILPQREHILRGVLSSNVIGFHNFQYVQHFLTTCIHVLGLECTATGIEACEDAGGTHTKVITVPLGINIEPYKQILSQPDTSERIRNLHDTFSGKKILVAVDRLEEKKGIRHKMMAFHRFLQKSPDWASRCVFVQIVEPADDVPTGDNTEGESEEQQRLLQQVYEMVGEINSKFGTIGHLPVHFLCQECSRVDLAALYVKAHVMIDTPLRDVLSLSAHEFLCCQEEMECGVLILSEFSGSAQSLRAAALSVNPWDTNNFADAIQEALEMEFHDRVELHRYGHRYVHEYTLKHWATNFLDELRMAESECETERLQIPPQLDHDKPVTAMRKACRRLVILGFSGTLVPHWSRIHTKILPKLPSVLVGNLEVIADDPNTHVIIISGMSRYSLQTVLANVKCWVIAEGGICYREPCGNEWHNSMDTNQRDTEWLEPVKQIMEYFAARTPGSTVVEMDSSVSWLYQKTQGDHAAIQSKDLLIHLWAGPLLSAPAEVVVEKDSVNVRPTGTGKAAQLEKLLQQICCEEGVDKPVKWLCGDALVICAGDFLMRDEDIFSTVHKFFEHDGAGRQATDGPDREQPRAPIASAQNHSSSSLAEDINRSESWGGEDSENWRGTGTAQDDKNLAANSMSLGTGLVNFNRMSQSLDREDGVFGLHSALGGETLLKKIPSEPDLQVIGEPDSPDCYEAGTSLSEACSAPAVFTCAVSRKATRACYHLTDTNDLAFLIAKLARELRQAKQVND